MGLEQRFINIEKTLFSSLSLVAKNNTICFQTLLPYLGFIVFW
jgi:hypothetical protein